MKVNVEVPELAELSVMDGQLEALQVELEILLNELGDAYIEEETEALERLIRLLLAVRPWLVMLRFGTGVLATQSIDKTEKGNMQ